MTQGCLLSSITRAGRAPSALALLAPVNSLAHEPKESVIDSGPFAEYASAHEEAEDGIQTRRCAPTTATAEQGPTTSQTDFHGGIRLRVGRVAAASTLPTLGNGSSSLGEEFPLPLHRSREIDARNIQTGKRERTQPPEHDYGEVQRRKARGGWTPTYFTQARKRQKKDDIQVGAATLARVTGGGYDHRDGGHARRKRKRLFDDGDRRAGRAGRHR